MVDKSKIKKKGMTIKYVNYNNKSRKGVYAYIRENKISKLYKVKKDIETQLKILQKAKKKTLAIDNIYKDAFRSGLVKKGRTGVTKKEVTQIKKAKKNLASKYTNIEDSLLSGYAETTTDLSGLSHYNIKRAYMNLLRNTDKKGEGQPIVKDSLLINVLTLPENVDKWKHRIMYKIHLKNDKDEAIMDLVPDNLKTLVQIKQELGETLKYGMDIDTLFSKAVDTAKAKGYQTRNVNTGTKGKLGKMTITLTYRKA